MTTVEIADKTLVPSNGNAAMLLRTATVTAKKGSRVTVEYREEGSLGRDVVRVREIDKIVVHGSGDITIHLKE